MSTGRRIVVSNSFVDPLALGNLALWLDPSDPATLFDATSGGSLPGDGVGVARIEDKSGNGRHFTQATSAIRPTRRVNVQNGLAVLRFDGTQRIFRGSSDLGRNLSGCTVYSVRKFAVAPTAAQFEFFLATTTAALARIIIGAGLTSDRTVAGSRRLDANAAVNVDGTLAVGTAWGVFSAAFDYANDDLLTYLNGAADGSNTSWQSGTTGQNTSNTASAGAVLGSNNGATPASFFNGDRGDLLMYHAHHSAATRQRVWNYLRHKWAI